MCHEQDYDLIFAPPQNMTFIDKLKLKYKKTLKKQTNVHARRYVLLFKSHKIKWFYNIWCG